MGLGDRILRIFRAEANTIVNKLEDPVKVTEQGIRDLKKDLTEAIDGLAEINALKLSTKKELVVAEKTVKESNEMVVKILAKANSGAIDPDEAERLADKLSIKLTTAESKVETTKRSLETLITKSSQMGKQVDKVKTMILKFESELTDLKARAKVSKVTEKINKQLANVDDSSTVSSIERMKAKVEEQENRANAYADIAEADVSLEDELEAAVGGSALDKLRARQKKD